MRDEQPTPDPEIRPQVEESLLLRLWSDGEAEVVRQLLETYGIPCRTATDLSHALFPLSVDGLGETRLFVPSDRLAEAESRLAEHRREGLRIADEPEGEGDPAP